MQISQLVSLVAVAAPLVSAAAVELVPRDTVPISYATAYLDETLFIKDFGCGAGQADTLLKDYAKFVDVLADYTAIHANPLVVDDRSLCGACYALSYKNAEGKERTVYAITVDATAGYYNLDKAGFAGLDGYGSFAAGTLYGNAVKVDTSKCKRAAH